MGSARASCPRTASEKGRLELCADHVLAAVFVGGAVGVGMAADVPIAFEATTARRTLGCRCRAVVARRLGARAADLVLVAVLGSVADGLVGRAFAAAPAAARLHERLFAAEALVLFALGGVGRIVGVELAVVKHLTGSRDLQGEVPGR